VSRVRHHYDAIGWDSGNKEYICCCFLRKVMSEMANDHGPVVQSALLRDELVRLRTRADLAQDQVAVDLGWATSKLIRLEGGPGPVAPDDLDALLGRYGATATATAERLRELNRGADDAHWWAEYRNDVPAAYLDYVGWERGAVRIRQFPGPVLPGLLQLTAYAEALTEMTGAPDRGARVVELRLRRQSELAGRDNPPQQHYILDEAVIRRRTGASRDRTIMTEQLRYIARVAEGSGGRVIVQVIPFERGEHAGLSGPFTLLDFDGGLPGILYLDPGRDPIEMTAHHHRVADFTDTFERLRVAALPAAESLELIRGAVQDVA